MSRPGARRGPSVASVAFDRSAHAPQCSGGHNGLAVALGDTAEVYICLTTEELCEHDDCASFRPNAQLLVLHELAHAWMDQRIGDETQPAFLVDMGLREWYSPDVEWRDRGVEQAAQVTAWGLMEEPINDGPPGDAVVRGARQRGRAAHRRRHLRRRVLGRALAPRVATSGSGVGGGGHGCGPRSSPTFPTMATSTVRGPEQR